MDNIKRDHEKFVADQLVALISPNLKFLRMGNDKEEPDVIYQDGSTTVGVEVTIAYYEESDARQEWMHARGRRKMPDTGSEWRDGGVLYQPDDMICQSIQEKIDEKTKKQYLNVDRTWLCVEARAPLGDDESFGGCAANIVVPADNGFEKIWLFYLSPLHNGGVYKTISLL